MIPEGRLTLTSGCAVPTASVASASNVLWTPCGGRQVPLWNGTSFAMTDVGGELSQPVADTTKSPYALAPGQICDVFVWQDAGGVFRLSRGPFWSAGGGPASRALVAGVLVNAPAIMNGPGAGFGTFVGTIGGNAAAAVDFVFGGAAPGGVAASFGLWNAYNQVPFRASVIDTTSSWAYAGGTRCADGSINNRVSLISGAPIYPIRVSYTVFIAMAAHAGAAAYIGYALDSTTTMNKNFVVTNPVSSAFVQAPTVSGVLAPQVGSHFVQAMESSDTVNSSTFFGIVNGMTQAYNAIFEVEAWQ